MRTLTALAAALGLAACAPATQMPAVETGGSTPGLWANPPDCVTVMRIEVDPVVGLPAPAIEAAVARHLSGRVETVIGPARREALTRRLGLDLNHAGDRERFAALTGCRHAALARVWGGRAWAVVWSEAQIGVDLAIVGLAEGRPGWQTRRVARRGDGGLPLSPVSAVMATGLAARAALDGGVMESVLDDALRAAAADLPDFRDPQVFASRNSTVRPLSSRK